MQAIVFDKASEPSDVLRVADIPDPVAEGEMAVVQVAARPIHPADLAFIRGQYRLRPAFPQIAGLEGSGIVVASPSPAFRPGMRVAFRYPGAWAEIAAVPVERLIAVPPDISETLACQISLNPITAWALLDESKAEAGDWIVLTAATSGVSNLIAQIARRRGIHTIGVVRGDAREGERRSSTDHVVSGSAPVLGKRISDLAGTAPITALLDSVGGPLIATLMAPLAPGAYIVAYGVQDRAPAAITNATLIYSNLTWKGFGIDRWLSQQTAAARAAMISEIWAMIRSGALSLPVNSSHRLSDFANALAADRKPGRLGKVILA
jgi:NADPH:quinone reductase-like Zn-dependent oxidoreductase